MFNNEDILMGSSKKPIMFELVYAGSGGGVVLFMVSFLILIIPIRLQDKK